MLRRIKVCFETRRKVAKRLKIICPRTCVIKLCSMTFKYLFESLTNGLEGVN